MALTKKDLDLIKGVVVEVVEQVVTPRFDQVEEQLDGVEQRLDGVEQRLDGVEQRLDGVEQRLDGIDRRIDKLAEVVTDVKTNHERRIRKLEKEAGIEASTIAI